MRALLPTLLPLLALAGCPYDWEGTWKGRDGAAAERAAPDLDLAGDAPADAPAEDQSPGEAAPPDAAGPRLTCGPVALVGTSQPPSGLWTPALRASGLEIIAGTTGTGWYASTRAAVGQPFGPWSKSALPFAAGHQDPAFVSIAGTEQLLVAVGPEPRRLDLCDLSLACKTLTVRWASGSVVVEDMDGPSMVELPGGGLLLAHNIETVSTMPDIYLSQPIDPLDPSQGWQAAPVTAVNQPNHRDDDPSLSADGLVLVFVSRTPAGDDDVWVSVRSSLSQPFPAAEPLVGLNSSGQDSAPCVGMLPAAAGQARYEIFYSSDRSGDVRVYRAECAR